MLLILSLVVSAHALLSYPCAMCTHTINIWRTHTTFTPHNATNNPSRHLMSPEEICESPESAQFLTDLLSLVYPPELDTALGFCLLYENGVCQLRAPVLRPPTLPDDCSKEDSFNPFCQFFGHNTDRTSTIKLSKTESNGVKESVQWCLNIVGRLHEDMQVPVIFAAGCTFSRGDSTANFLPYCPSRVICSGLRYGDEGPYCSEDVDFIGIGDEKSPVDKRLEETMQGFRDNLDFLDKRSGEYLIKHFLHNR